jgi:UDP-N-acetylglucosamine 2-epimerase
VVFPVHPRTRQRIEEFGFDAGKLHMSGPVPDVKFLALQRLAAVVIIDSGGIQEETATLGAMLDLAEQFGASGDRHTSYERCCWTGERQA